MDDAAFEPIFQRQLAELIEFVRSEGVLPPIAVLGRRLCLGIEGLRANNRKDSFTLCVDARGFPLYPFDVGFVDPTLDPSLVRSDTNLKEPKWFPYDGETRFKTSFHTEPRVFVCIQPGFSQEYFVHHTNEQWNPHAWSLLRVVHQVRSAISGTPYQCPSWERK
jgi:hypothetical protein